MIKKIREITSKFVFSEEIPLNGRIFNLILIFGVLACVAATTARIIEGVSKISVTAVTVMIVIIIITFWFCNKFKLYKLGSWLALIAFCDILFPLVYLTNGGIESGMTGYFCLSIMLNFLLLKGWACFLMSVLNFAVIFACYYINQTWPGLITPFAREFQKYADHVQTVLITGLFMGFVIKYQVRIYEKEKAKAEAATKAKADFLANVSHEIRTPLNAIIGLGELELGKDIEEGTRNNLEKMYSSGMVLLSIINDLLDISKIESGHFELFPVEYDISSLINDTIHLNMVRIGSKPISFRLRIDAELPSRLYGDEIRVRQILNNLLSNAFKYTREGQVRLCISMEKVDKKSMNLVCRIEDTGIGIRKEDIEKLFSVYNQLDAKSNRHIEGTGLGLSICKNLVELMGGAISVESEYKKGSAFTAVIPQKIISEKPIGSAAAENLESFRFTAEKREQYQRHRVRMPYARVLVVDDVSTNLDVARGMLMPYELTIDCVASGREAIALIREEKVKYDAVFMDHMMPEMDGIETVRIIRNKIESEYAKTVPIIALTANAILGNDKLFLENGFQDFLTKPIDMTKLDTVLMKWVRDKTREAVLTDPEPALAYPRNETPVPSIEGLDWTDGLRRMGNQEASYIRVLDSYVANLPAMLDKLREFNAASLSAYMITVHGIKGASYGICANDIGKQAEALEMAARNGDTETILANNGSFILRAEKFIADLAADLASRQ
jgi:signal transduction histidine kinase/AmiR/NasT family two-component response regulator/HPt (histidine-containing phosphotransfer) domain-containing protein